MYIAGYKKIINYTLNLFDLQCQYKTEDVED